MNKVPPGSGLERTERLLDLVPYLATHQGIALDDLALEFSVSPSQITEDLTTLWMCGLPGYTPLELMDISFDTGVVSISNAETLAKPRVLNRDEVLALVLGLESLQADVQQEHLELRDSISALVAKLIHLVDANFKQRVQVGSTALSAERAQIEKAIISRGAIDITYHSLSRDEISQRVIHPLEISTSRGHDYVLAFCELTKSYRTFRLDRIAATKSVVHDQNALPTLTASSTDNRFHLTLRIHSRWRDVAEGFNLDLDPTQGDVVEVVSFSPDWSIRQILRLGGEVTLETPQELKNSLRERAIRALSAYTG